ncbi:MAG: aspartate 1-decarboxylase [Candidatus Cloacimonetes bacterium]|nr:aspartate 1-decarboxylase [Candidatus Cloacimonadota bacterium]
MYRSFLFAKIHHATVNERDLNYVGSISIDRDILAASGLLPDEKVDIYNITNGERFSTYVLEAESGSGKIGLNGAAAHKVALGDKVIIVSYCQLAEREIPHHKSRIIVIQSEDNLKWTIKE